MDNGGCGGCVVIVFLHESVVKPQSCWHVSKPTLPSWGYQKGTESNLGACACAAWSSSLSLSGVLDGVHDLEEAWSLSTDGLTGLDHGCLHVGGGASAAALGEVSGGQNWSGGRLTGWLLAHKLALGAGAQSGLLALPVTLGLLTHGCAEGVWCSAGGTALGWGAHGLALRAVSGLTHVLGATDVALRLVTVDLAGGTWSLLTMNLALWSLAHWVALCWAAWVITLPSALRVALGDGSRGGLSEHSGQSEETDNNQEERRRTHSEELNVVSV